MSMSPGIIEPDWPAPAGIQAFCTTRRVYGPATENTEAGGGGESLAPFDRFNLGHHVGDNAAAVAANRRRLQDLLPPGITIQWLRQVHGTRAVRAPIAGDYPEGDASWTRRRATACAILTADCLPVLLCDRAATVVGAAHAGWRGLVAGVLEATVAAMEAAPGDLLAWLGPAIGPDAFEVGAEVREAFCEAARPGTVRQRVGACFRPSGRPGHYLADLYALARLRLAAAGVTAVYGGGLCTYSDAARFYSYRRDGETGRMASVITLC